MSSGGCLNRLCAPPLRRAARPQGDRSERSPDWVKVKNRQHPAMERVMEAMSWASRSSPGTDRPAAHHRA
jgi:hypothetical protein